MEALYHQTFVLETASLILRSYKNSDAEAVFEVVNKRKIAETTMNIPHPYPREHVNVWIEYVQNSFRTGRAYEFAVFLKEEPLKYIGNCGFVHISEEHHNGELGYFIDPNYWGEGYASEACQRIVEFGFSKLQLERIYGRCMAKNRASKRVMEKSGLKLEGIFKSEVFKWGQFEDVNHLSIIRSEWCQGWIWGTLN